MEDPKRRLADWWNAGHTVAVATVCDTWQSAPRVPGSIMVLGPDGEVTGSVSGGCVEGAVHESCVDALATGRPRLEHYGVSDDEAFSVGLTCGGEIDVFVEPVSPESYPELGEALSIERRPVAVATVIAHELSVRVGRHLVIHESSVLGSLGSEALDAAVAREAKARAADGKSTVVAYQHDEIAGEPAVRVFLSVPAIPARLLVFGATDLTAAVVSLGTFAGYHVTVCDARSVFATPGRFHDAAEVINEWPHRYLAREAAEGRIDERTVLADCSLIAKREQPGEPGRPGRIDVDVRGIDGKRVRPRQQVLAHHHRASTRDQHPLDDRQPVIRLVVEDPVRDASRLLFPWPHEL